MNPASTPYIRRSAALALLAGTLALGALALFRPYAALFRDGEDEIRSLETRLLHYRKTAASGPAFARQIERLQNDPGIAGQYLKSTTAALAGAELQQHIQKWIEQHGARTVSMQTVDEHARKGSHAVTVRIRMQAGLQAFRDLLYTLETRQPLLTLDNLSVRQLGAGRGSDGNEEALDIGFDATAYRMEPAP